MMQNMFHMIFFLIHINIIVETVILFFRMLWWTESSKEQNLFEIEITLEMLLLSLLINVMYPC